MTSSLRYRLDCQMDEWDEQAEDDMIAELNVFLKMAGKSGSVFRYAEGPGIVLRCWWPTGPGSGFEEDELYDDSHDPAAFEKLKARVHRITTARMIHTYREESHEISDKPVVVKYFADHRRQAARFRS